MRIPFCRLRQVCGKGRLLPLVTVLLAIPGASTALGADPVDFVPLYQKTKFSNSIAPGALQLACAAREEQLAPLFAERRLPFDRSLIRQVDGRYCHIYFEPSQRGFRAYPESAPVRGLFLDVDPLAFLTRRSTPVGDSLDIAKTVLANVQRPLEMVLGAALTIDRPWYEQALKFHFPGAGDRISLRVKSALQREAWTQDYIKAGQVRGTDRLMVPRIAFEGRFGDGKGSKSMLDSFTEKSWARSQLSWEGGDLQFVLDPMDPRRLLLFHGDAARSYWGDILTDAEHAYLLKLEFGADEAVDFSGMAPHVDYFVAFLPADRIALVAQPRRNDYDLGREALNVLMSTFPNPMPPVLRELDSLYSSRETASAAAPRIRQLISRARVEYQSWSLPANGALVARLEQHIASSCPDKPTDCLAAKRIPGLLSSEMRLLRDWVDVTAAMRTAQALPKAMLSVMESQLPGTPVLKQPLIDARIRQLEKLGFRVIRVPQFGEDGSEPDPWAGISYTNFALVDDTLFVPAFGFGDVERRYFDEIQSQLPGRYRVVPTFARSALLQNGGVHCVVAYLRAPRAVGAESPAPLKSTSD